MRSVAGYQRLRLEASGGETSMSTKKSPPTDSNHHVQIAIETTGSALGFDSRVLPKPVPTWFADGHVGPRGLTSFSAFLPRIK